MNKLLLLALVILFFIGLFTYMMWMPGQSYNGKLPPLTKEEERIAQRLNQTVYHLAETIGPRHVFKPNAYEETIEYLHDTFTSMGYEVTQMPVVAENFTAYNLEVMVPGQKNPEHSIIIGAHYDSVDHDECPAANDNGSGVAVTLELARLFKQHQPDKTVRFVLFANEEPPFFRTKNMGSYVYANHLKSSKQQVTAMFSLETMGYFRDEPGSQAYPFLFGLFYPTEGDFIAFVGNLTNAGLTRRSVKAFRSTTDFPAEGVGMLSFITGVDWSDHWSFWKHGYPALMVTDTAFYRYPYYHTRNDRPEHIDYGRLAKVTKGLERVILSLATQQ